MTPSLRAVSMPMVSSLTNLVDLLLVIKLPENAIEKLSSRLEALGNRRTDGSYHKIYKLQVFAFHTHSLMDEI